MLLRFLRQVTLQKDSTRCPITSARSRAANLKSVMTGSLLCNIHAAERSCSHCLTTRMLPRACRAAPSLPLRSSAIWTLPPSSSARLVHASSAVAAPPPSRSKVPSFLQLRDEGIQTRFIRVVQQDGSLGPLILRDNVLDKMDRQKQRLMKGALLKTAWR